MGVPQDQIAVLREAIMALIGHVDRIGAGEGDGTMADETETRTVSEQAGAGTRGVEAGASQQVAGVGASGAGGTSDQAVTASENIADIGQAEAWMLNMKRTVANELDHDVASRDVQNRRTRNAEDHDQGLRSEQLQSIIQARTHQANLNAQVITARDLWIDRQANVDETNAFAAALGAAVAKAINTNDSGS